MKHKIMIHYAVSFFVAALFLVIVNVMYMQNSVYQNEQLYHFDADPYLNQIIKGINLNASSELEMTLDLSEYLRNHGIGIQIIDEQFKEVFQANNHSRDIQRFYTPEELINLYESHSTTAFIRGQRIENKDYTILMFMDPSHVRRRLYTYDVALVGATYNPIWLIGMNGILLLLISYMYTNRISQPINRMNECIIRLSKGHYDVESPGKGIYKNVEVAINTLAKQLQISQQERALADVAREEWISNLSHDIKTPLTSMMGYGELLGDPEYPLSSEERNKYKEIILEKGAYIENLLEDLNMATRLKHQQLPLNMEPVELISEIKVILIDVLNTGFNEENVSFTHTEDHIKLSVDRRLFKRALVNLIHNAFVHNERPVSVKVHVEVEDTSWVAILIEDDGIGVKTEELPRIFTRYYRGTHTNTKKEGSGLGLAIAKDIIEAHKGNITVEKSSLGGLKIILKLKVS
ncbi:sensor histidine kinase [Natronincola ferrireducens]|uniref:histidine kinase n=1 Tax=Natronincola ferrireducens TaxID=393762 RepID=A0A1G9IT45_9FIRM|nr:HAMP domain-containing sensor histidine kinase [Natronincola ferrireducens]SDL28377.1 His Kinase A (phospho-acceptor) domain-containing protein [Natronincola ferrireducens]